MSVRMAQAEAGPVDRRRRSAAGERRRRPRHARPRHAVSGGGCRRAAQQHVETGVRNKPKAVTPIIPENTAMPIAWRISAPAPVEKASGSTPITNATEVMRIGPQPQPARLDRGLRAASCPPTRARARTPRSGSRSWPTSPRARSSPICVKMLLSPCVSHTPVIAASSPIGTMRMIDSGSVRLS